MPTINNVLITGSSGLVGSTLKFLTTHPYCCHTPDKLIFINREYGDLTIEQNVAKMYKEIKPTSVIHLAAKVGGVGGNMAHQAEFFHQNILMNTHIIHHAYLNNVKRFLAFTSVCVFPDGLNILTENDIHIAPPHDSNFAYAYTKRMIDIQIQAYISQYKIKNYCNIIPCNLYGPNDNYNLENGHVIPTLIHKLYLAKQNNTDLNVWGDGSAIREFLYIDDLASIVIQLLFYDKELPARIIIANPEQHSIKSIINKLVEITNFTGNVIYDNNKPNGQYSRPSDISLLKSLLPHIIFTDINEGLKRSYKWFELNYPRIRK